jgi:hypothetical protein
MVCPTKILALIVPAALITAACGGRQATTGGGGSPFPASQTTTPQGAAAKGGAVDPCQWFSQADAEAVLETPVKQVKGTGGYGLGECTYTAGEDQLRIEAGTVQDYEFLVARYKDAEKIAGVGQEAIWVSFFSSLDIKLNDTHFAAVTVSNENKELAIEVGKKVAAAAAA